MTDPNFMLIGAQKCGTSWLARMLSQHPDIYIPEEKELHFFNKKENYAKGIDWYRGRFAGRSGEQMIGDCTPNYLWVKDAPESVQEALRARGKAPIEFRGHELLNRNIAELVRKNYPDLKLIVALRDPVERAISSFVHAIRFRHISPRSNILEMGGRGGILGMGFYYEQLLEWMSHFDHRQFLVLIYEEDIVRAKSETLRKVFRHLDVDPEFRASDQSALVNKRPCNLFLYLNYYLPWLPSGRLNHIELLRRVKLPPIRLSASDRTELYEIYQPEYRKLENLLGRSLTVWEPGLAR